VEKSIANTYLILLNNNN